MKVLYRTNFRDCSGCPVKDSEDLEALDACLKCRQSELQTGTLMDILPDNKFGPTLVVASEKDGRILSLPISQTEIYTSAPETWIGARTVPVS